MITLALDASTYLGTVAVLDGHRVIAEGEAAMRGREAEALMPAVGDTLRRSGLDLAVVDRIVCGAGPGSFTSLRIAASLAKGLAVGKGIPLFAVPSLALIVAGNVQPGSSGESRRYCAVLDALRSECFAATFEHVGPDVMPLGATRLVPKADVERTAQHEQAVLVGPEYGERWSPHARGASLLASLLKDERPVNLAAWEPTYGRMAEAQAKWEAAHGRVLPR